MIDKYFDSHVQYPHYANDPMPIGVWQEYVASTFLNGWINAVKPVAAALITRYRGHADNQKRLDEFHRSPPIHPNIGGLGDDVLLLAKSPDGLAYWLFWFDCDVSDCGIGRFLFPPPTEASLVVEFHEWANAKSVYLSKSYSINEGCELNASGCPALSIDVSKLSGWVSF